MGGTNESNEGNESYEGNEESHEEACHEEGGRRGGPDEEEACDEGNESNEGYEESDEGNESHEGYEGNEEVIAEYGPQRQSAEMTSLGGVPRRALLYVPV